MIPLTVETSRARQGYAPNMDALRKELAPPLVVVCKLEGTAMPVELSLWIEEEAGRYMLNTVKTWPLEAKANGSPRYCLLRLDSSRWRLPPRVVTPGPRRTRPRRRLTTYPSPYSVIALNRYSRWSVANRR